MHFIVIQHTRCNFYPYYSFVLYALLEIYAGLSLSVLDGHYWTLLPRNHLSDAKKLTESTTIVMSRRCFYVGMDLAVRSSGYSLKEKITGQFILHSIYNVTFI